MAERNLLCIEPDSDTVAEIRNALSPYGFGVESIPNGEEAIEWGRSNPVSLILLCVEPRKVGYAICNKLKRSPSLREIPLILISSEETQATFEQHRKLKAHADEYLLKPLDITELLAKVNRLVPLGEKQDAEEIHEADSGDIIIADEEIAAAAAAAAGEDSASGPSDIGHHASGHDNGQGNGEGHLGADGVADEDSEDVPTAVAVDAHALEMASSLEERPGDTSEQAVVDSQEMSPFQGETFDSETQAAFDALEAGSTEGGTPAIGSGSGDLVDLRSLWTDDDLPASLGWETPPKTLATPTSLPDPDGYRSGNTLGPELFAPASAEMGQSAGAGFAHSLSQDARQAATEALAHELPHHEPTQITSPDLSHALGAVTDEFEEAIDEIVDDVPPSPDEVENDEPLPFGDARTAPVSVLDDGRVRELEARGLELQARISSLEMERQTLRKELEESRERFNQTATFSKEREFLALREIINKKEKDILDLREDLDAKERQVLDHKDKIRELERARRDLEEKTLGFERSVVASTEKISELTGDREKSTEREKGLKARLDDAHIEIHKTRDEVEAMRKRMAQEEARARAETERVRVELESRIREIEDAHRLELGRFKDEQSAESAAVESARQAELVRLEAAHKAEVDILQRRLADEQAAAADRFSTEVARLRREHDKALTASKEEQGLQLTSERQAYEALTEAKERDHRNEILGMRRRHEEELTAAEERRQRDITEHEGRRVAELDSAEGRRRAELQGRDEEHHVRITEVERRHLTEKTELSERHRAEYDQALGRAARAEGELVARVQEIEQAYRRLAGFEADLDASRGELGDREVRLAQTRDRISELESKVTDYEEQIVRAYQRLRADEKTTEKARRALAVALALIDERASAQVSGTSSVKSGPVVVSEEAQQKT
jgi:CheY-like chemotaxis protein